MFNKKFPVTNIKNSFNSYPANVEIRVKSY